MDAAWLGCHVGSPVCRSSNPFMGADHALHATEPSASSSQKEIKSIDSRIERTVCRLKHRQLKLCRIYGGGKLGEQLFSQLINHTFFCIWLVVLALFDLKVPS